VCRVHNSAFHARYNIGQPQLKSVPFWFGVWGIHQAHNAIGSHRIITVLPCHSTRPAYMIRFACVLVCVCVLQAGVRRP